MNWFADSFRKVHILYVSPQWARAQGVTFDAQVYADSLAAASVDCVELYCKDHHGTCYFPCSLGLTHPRNVLGELLPALQQRGMRLMAYVSVCFDNYALGLHPEWRAVNRHGDPYKVGPFVNACLSSPYTDFVLQQIQELAEAYPVDGFWLDIIPLARDLPQPIWMTTPHPAPCYCLSCHQRYRAETGEPLPRQPTAAQEERAYRFLTDQVDTFMQRAMARIRAARPDALVTYNGAGSPGDPLDAGDLISIEGHAPYYSRQSFIARWAKPKAKPFEILTAGGLPRFDLGGGWNGFDQKPPTIMQVEAAIAAAHGGSAVFGQAPYPSGATDPGQYAGFGQVFTPIRPLEPWLRRPSGVADVGLLLAAKPRSASARWCLMQEGAEAFHEALLDTHLQYEIVDMTELAEEADLGRYQGLILADQAALSDKEMELLRRYVHQGGRLLASGVSSLFTADGAQQTNFGLSDLFGVSYRADPGHTFAYIRLHESALAHGVTALPIFVDESPLEVTATGAAQMADLLYPEAHRTDATTVLWGDPPPDETQRHPALCHHTYGAGSCWYAAWPLRARGMRNAWVKRLMGILAAQLVPAPVLRTNAPAGVELVLNRQAGRHVLHLINVHMGDPDRISFPDRETTLRGLTVDLHLPRLGLTQAARVYAPPDQDLAYQVDGEWLQIPLPPIGVHGLVVVE